MFFIFLYIWLVFNGRVTVEVLLLGCFVAIAVSVLFYKSMGYSATTDVKILRNFPLLILYALNLVLEILKAAVMVTALVWNPSKRPDPVMVEFHSGLEGSLSNVVLANSITLTPGTYTVVQEGDRFVVHCLRPEYAEGLEDSSFVRLLRRIKR